MRRARAAAALVLAALAPAAVVAAQAARGPTRADPLRLPVAARQLPDFAHYPGRTLPAGRSYLDPVTRVRVWRVTDARTPVPGADGTHDYSSGPVQVSRSFMGAYTVLVSSQGTRSLVDFRPGRGLTNWRPAPGVNTDLSFTFALDPRTPWYAYYLHGTTLYRYDVRTNARADGGNFPHDFGRQTGSAPLWLQQDRDDRWFVLMPADQSAIIAWNARTGQTRVLTRAQIGMAIDEPHLERDGRWVMVSLSPQDGAAPDWLLWDLTTGAFTAPISKHVHPGALRSLFASVDPRLTNGPQWTYDPARRVQTNVLSAAQLSPDGQHRADQWIQSDSATGGDPRRQWLLWSGFSDGVVTATRWTRVDGEVYESPVDYGAMYEKPAIGVRSVRQLAAGGRGVARQLAPAASARALVEGSFHFDPATRRVYVWARGGGDPTGRVDLRAPGTLHDAIGFVRADGSDVRLLAHHYSLPTRYWDIPRATVSPDGRIVLFDSNMNDPSGRIDVFLVEVPTTP